MGLQDWGSPRPCVPEIAMSVPIAHAPKSQFSNCRTWHKSAGLVSEKFGPDASSCHAGGFNKYIF